MFLPEPAVLWRIGFRIGRHEVGVVAVHPDAGDELDVRLTAERGEHGHRPFCGFDEAADVLRFPSRALLEVG